MSIEVGAKVKGKVTGITNFGAFVDLGDHETGLVHISEISDQFIKDIHDVLSVNDEVMVKVLSIKDGKIALSIRKAEDKPKEERPHASNHREGNPHHNGGNNNRHFNNHHDRGHDNGKNFDALLSGFLKESDERLSSLKRNTEGKRGGRGGRRS